MEAPRKRRRCGPSVVLLDIEGTTTPISFVKEITRVLGHGEGPWESQKSQDRLFPYAASAVASWVETAGAELEEVAKEYEKQCKEAAQY